MVTKTFNVRAGIKTGNILINATNDSIIANSITTSGRISAAELSATKVTSNLIPKTNAAYDLGSIAEKFKDLNLSGVINIGTQTISADVSGISVTGDLSAESANIETLNANTINANSLNIDTVTVNTQMVINSNMDATSTDTGSIITAGGVGIAKNLYVGGSIHLANGLGGTSSKGIINYNDGGDSIDFNFNG